MSGFSIDGFSDWFKNKDQESSFEIQKTKKYELIGMEATSKISSRKLAEKMNALDGNCDQLALEFVESGGTRFRPLRRPQAATEWQTGS